MGSCKLENMWAFRGRPHFSWVGFCFKTMCLGCLKVFLMVWEALRFRTLKFPWVSVNNKPYKQQRQTMTVN